MLKSDPVSYGKWTRLCAINRKVGRLVGKTLTVIVAVAAVRFVTAHATPTEECIRSELTCKHEGVRDILIELIGEIHVE